MFQFLRFLLSHVLCILPLRFHLFRVGFFPPPSLIYIPPRPPKPSFKFLRALSKKIRLHLILLFKPGMASIGSLVDILGGKTTDGKSRALWCWGEMGLDMMGRAGAMGTLCRDQLMRVGRSTYRTRACKYRCYRVSAVGVKAIKGGRAFPLL